MKTLSRIESIMQPGDTVYRAIDRANMTGPRCAACMDAATVMDGRPATPRRVLAALRRMAATGYAGRLVVDHILGTDTAPASDEAARQSVAAILRR